MTNFQFNVATLFRIFHLPPTYLNNNNNNNNIPHMLQGRSWHHTSWKKNVTDIIIYNLKI
jgi:hypothetical protein